VRNCIHFINRKVGLGREGLTHLGGGKYRSCCWLLSQDQVRSLVGGWIYLHETKTQASAFGGQIIAVEPGVWEHAPDQDRWAIIFQSAREAQGQAWRGTDYSMAYTSGSVEPSLPHEL
jgi:hypothetical protein